MGILLLVVTLVFSLMFSFNILLNSVGTIITPDASASPNSTLQELNYSVSQNDNSSIPDVIVLENQTLDSAQVNQSLSLPEEETGRNQSLSPVEEDILLNQKTIENTIRATQTAEQVTASRLASQLTAFATIIGTSVVAIALMIVVPLLFSMYLRYRQDNRMNSKGTSIRPVVINQLYRVLVAIGVIFVVVLIVVYLNSLVWFNTIHGRTEVLTALLETQKNFTTIIGTAFASLVAFYFGTRGTQNRNTEQSRNTERTTTLTSPETTQRALEVIDVNPVDGTVGVEVDSPVTATFSASVRSSTINTNTFSVKDASGNPVQGKISLTDNNTTVRFNPVPSFNRNSKYTVAIAKGVMHISGAPLAADIEWHFTTID